jgi:hypothetical protein
VGDKDTWITSIREDTWGFTNSTKGNWNTLSLGDYVAFYVTSPIKRIIGFGLITSKFIAEDLL